MPRSQIPISENRDARDIMVQYRDPTYSQPNRHVWSMSLE
jgi:hypothetical protein